MSAPSGQDPLLCGMTGPLSGPGRTLSPQAHLQTTIWTGEERLLKADELGRQLLEDEPVDPSRLTRSKDRFLSAAAGQTQDRPESGAPGANGHGFTSNEGLNPASLDVAEPAVQSEAEPSTRQASLPRASAPKGA
jgi:hypothetical protein